MAAFNNRGAEYKEKGDIDRAISDYSESSNSILKMRLRSTIVASHTERKAISTNPFATTTRSSNSIPKCSCVQQSRQRIHEQRRIRPRINDFDEAIKRDSKHADAFNNRGSAYAKKGDIDRAISDFDEAIKRDPKYAMVFRNRALAYKEKGDLDQSIRDYDEVINLDSKNVVAFNNRGSAIREER